MNPLELPVRPGEDWNLFDGDSTGGEVYQLDHAEQWEDEDAV